MGHWEVEHGEVLLPAAAVADVKKSLRDTHNAHVDKVYDHAKRFWKHHGTQSRDKYRDAVDAYTQSLEPSRSTWGWKAGTAEQGEALSKSVREVLRDVERNTRGGNLRGVTWDDMDQAGLGKKTNRDTRFSTFNDGLAGIEIDGRTVKWHTDEDRRAVERFHTDPMGRSLRRALNDVTWTRGTGGVSRTDDENAAESRQQYGGSVGVASWWGPRGAETYKYEHGFWPTGSPQAKADEAKRRKREATKAARKTSGASKPAKAAGAGQFCGAMKADKSGLCGRRITSGKCPDHGVSAKATVVTPTAVAGAAAIANANPFA